MRRLVHDPMHPDWLVTRLGKNTQYESAAYLYLRDSDILGRIVCPYHYVHILTGVFVETKSRFVCLLSVVCKQERR